MQMGSTLSPAAESYRRENERQTVRAELDEALEDTIPVSATRTTMAGKATVGTIDTEGFRSTVERRIRARPFAAVALAAGLGFIFGLTR